MGPKLFSFPLLAILLFSYSSYGRQAPQILEVMSYNVENLFDSLHDKDKLDWTFLPKGYKGKKEECSKIRYDRYRKMCLETNWTMANLKIKLDQIKDVLLKERKRLPEILALVEIENENVIGMLAKELGYANYMVSNGPDRRGIDLALLYNETSYLKGIKSTEHRLKGRYFAHKPTRDILEGEFLINGKHHLSIFVNHWPSLANPNHTRMAAAKALRAIILKKMAENKNVHIMALGDFNTIDSNIPNPFGDMLLNGTGLLDLHVLYQKSKKVPPSEKAKMAFGTYFYPPKRAWNRLDRIFVNPHFVNEGKSKGLVAIPESYSIYAPEFITTTYKYRRKKGHLFDREVKNTPHKYNFNASSKVEAGFSDHFPVVVKFKIK